MADDFKPGLEGIVAAQTTLSSVDGQRGELIISGFPLEELAANATFEEVSHLLWNGDLPDRATLHDFRSSMASYRQLPVATFSLLAEAAKHLVSPMDALRMATATFDLDLAHEDDLAKAKAITARVPPTVATYWRLYNNQDPIEPRMDLGRSANFLYMLTGEEPGPETVRGLETYLNTVSDHGLNASTFAARVIIATESDMVSAVTGAVGALKGPLHGGAPGPALDMVFEIGSVDRADSYIRGMLDRGDRLMGFGHRVYKVRDPRADVLSRAAERMYQAEGDMGLYELSKEVEATAIRLLDEYKPDRHLRTNVEFFTALLLHGIGLETPLFTPTFAAGRVAGWIGHCFEQQRTGRLIRPDSVYIGPRDRRWIPLDDR
ncbi:MAG TPA: citrate synthase/methylcitrate synthase [Acidimicrobiia bacterium]|nr:citrate synthase/methylcitrate synthase [Acidimicrobiia bacterium]